MKRRKKDVDFVGAGGLGDYGLVPRVFHRERRCGKAISVGRGFYDSLYETSS
jgi:hypothetical protein